MKLSIIYFSLSFAACVYLLSCSKDKFTQINTDPTTSTADNYNPNYLLTTVQLNYTGSSDNGAEVAGTELGGAGCFIQHLASLSGFFWGDKYLFSPGNAGSYFDHAYTSQVKFAVDLLQLTKDKPQYKNLYEIARIMKALAFERLTDIYGDVPYSQAGLGYYERIYNPVYDRQQDIYTDLLKEVENATDSLDDNADKPTGDMFYAGKTDQIEKWKKLGNTLLLRMAMRLTKVDPATAQAYVQKVLGKTMESNGDNALVYHSEDGGWVTQNRVTVALSPPGVRFYGKLSNKFVSYLKINQDPRLPIIAQLPSGITDTSAQFGLPNGYDEGASATGISNYPGYLGSEDLYSEPGNLLVTYTAPSFILTYAEAELLFADAAKRWGIGGDAATHYKNGVIAAIKELSAYGSGAVISDANATKYYNSHPYDDSKGLEMINTQFWAATFFNDYEAWSNWRRTGYPQLTPVVYPGNASGGTIPRRMYYPTSEKQSNAVNYSAAVAALPGGDELTSRMWWDVR